jgi:phosphatidylinositol 3-kinase
MLYLLQLVQALKYENYDHIVSHSQDVVVDAESVPSSRKVSIEESGESAGKAPKYAQNFKLEQTYDKIFYRDLKGSSSSMSSESASNGNSSVLRTASLMDSMTLAGAPLEPVKPNLELNMDLATFLIHRACLNSTLSNYFFW